MDSDEGEYEQMMLGSAPVGGGSGRPYLSTSLPTGSHLYSSYDGEEVPHVPLPKKLYPPPPHPSAASSSSAGTTSQGLATSNSTPSTSSSSSSAATHFPSTSSSFYSGPNLGRLSPRFSLPSSYGAYPSPVSLHTNAAQPQFSSLLSVISNKAPTFVEHHGGGGSGGVGTTSHRPPRDRDREGSSKVEAKEAREREKLDKKERKKWNKLKNRTLGDSTSPTNSITSIASLASPSGVGAKGGTIEVPRRPDRVPPPQQQLDPRGGEAGGLDATTIARRTTAAAIAAAAASVANGGAAPGCDATSPHHGAGYSFSPAHMEEAGGAPHTTHRYRSPSVVKRPSKGKALLISRLSSNALGLYDSSSAIAVPAPSSGGASSPYAAEHAHSSPDLESSSPWTDAVIKLNIGGVKYTTSRTTLMRLPNTYFSVLLSGKFPAIRDHEGAFFIDRDGRLFDPILSFLRTNHLKIPEGLSLEEVLGEMEFYGMTELSEHIASSMVSSHPGYKYFMCQLPRPEASPLDDRPARKAKRDKQKKKDKLQQQQQQMQQQQQQQQQQMQQQPADGKKTSDNPSSSSAPSSSSSAGSSSASPMVAGPNGGGGGGGGSVAGVSISVSGPGSNGDISVVGSSAAPVAPAPAAPSAPISAPPPSGLGAAGGNSGSGSGTSGSGSGAKKAAAAAAEERSKEKDNDEELLQQQRETAAAASLEASGAWLRREHAHSKVTQLCSKFNIVCAAYEDGSIACWKYENMALGWRLMFMESQCLPTADGLIMSATMTTTGQYTNLYLAVYSKKSALVCVWDQLHLKSGVKWGELQLELKDIISCNFMVNNCYLVAMSTDNSICIFDLREPPERNKIIYMCAPSHAISPSPSSFGPSSPRAPRELSARSMELSKKDRVMCVAVVDPFSFLGFDDGTICELAQHFNSHTHWEWVVAETWEDIDKEVITCLSCVVFTDRHGSNVLLTYGTEQGSVRLCSKVVNTRNFKLIFSAKGHHDQPINQVMISESHKSGGGLIFSSLSAGGTIKVWRYLYVDLPQPHVSCIACYNSGGSIDHFIYNSGLMQDMLTQMVFLERNLENIDGKEIEGRVESHLCVITNAENALTIYDDYYCVCSIKPVDGSSVTSCCVVSYDDLAAPKPYVRNQFITGHDNGTLQVWDLDLAFHHNKLSSHPYHHPYSFYPFYYAFHHSHGVSHPIKTTFK